jgi:hypothetical protein
MFIDLLTCQYNSHNADVRESEVIAAVDEISAATVELETAPSRSVQSGKAVLTRKVSVFIGVSLLSDN